MDGKSCATRIDDHCRVAIAEIDGHEFITGDSGPSDEAMNARLLEMVSSAPRKGHKSPARARVT
jgi:hypothetical protein